MKSLRGNPVKFDTTVPPTEDLTGKTYGKWTVEKYHGRRVTTGVKTTASVEMWECRCACGALRLVMKPSLIYNRSKQCPVCQAAALKEGADPLSLARRNMKLTWTRNLADMCPEWKEFPAFWEWVVAQKREKHSQLLRRDETKPHMEGNSFFGSEREGYDNALKVIAKAEGFTDAEAAQWAAKRSRQMVYAAAKSIIARKKELES
jgi:hypothetical protein